MFMWIMRVLMISGASLTLAGFQLSVSCGLIYKYSLAMANNWRELVAEKKQRQLQSIPKGWLISVPPRWR